MSSASRAALQNRFVTSSLPRCRKQLPVERSSPIVQLLLTERVLACGGLHARGASLAIDDSVVARNADLPVSFSPPHDRLHARRRGVTVLRQRPQRRRQRDRLQPLCRGLVVPAETIVFAHGCSTSSLRARSRPARVQRRRSPRLCRFRDAPRLQPHSQCAADLLRGVNPVSFPQHLHLHEQVVIDTERYGSFDWCHFRCEIVRQVLQKIERPGSRRKPTAPANDGE